MKNKFFLFSLFLSLLLTVPERPVTAQSMAAPTPVILEEISRLLSGYQFTEALALFDTINPAEAADSPIRLLKASILNSSGKANEARIIVEDIVSKEPNNLEALFVLSAIEAAAGRTREQQAVLERILSRDPRNVQALVELGKFYLDSRSIANATRYFDQALQIDPVNLDALLSKSQIYRFQRDPHNAEAMLNQAVRAHPNEAAPYQERARLYSGAGFHINALEDLDKAKELDPNDYWIAIDRAGELLELFRKEEALAEFERAIRIDSRDYLPYAYTAGIKDELGDYEGAERDYIILAGLNPQYYFAFEGIGVHKMRKHEWAMARDAFTEAYREAPSEYNYALLAAINWIKAETYAAPRQFLNQAMNRVTRDSLQYYMIRLFYDFTGRVYNGENDMLQRLSREPDSESKAQMLFYMALYYDLRGSPTLSNKYFQDFRDLNFRTLQVEWRLCEWFMTERGLLSN